MANTPTSDKKRQRTHGEPPEGLECLCTFDEITRENYCEYQSMPSGEWHPSNYAAEIVQELIDTQFQKYLDDVEKAARDCARAVRRLVEKGPPIWLSDQNALPIPEGDTHIEQVWYAAENEEKSAKLKGTLEGEARDKLWAAQKEVLKSMEEAERAANPPSDEHDAGDHAAGAVVDQ